MTFDQHIAERGRAERPPRAYEGGRTLFLGLGTNMGSVLVSDRVIVPLELGSLPYQGGHNMHDATLWRSSGFPFVRLESLTYCKYCPRKELRH